MILTLITKMFNFLCNWFAEYANLNTTFLPLFYKFTAVLFFWLQPDQYKLFGSSNIQRSRVCSRNTFMASAEFENFSNYRLLDPWKQPM